MFPLQEGSKEVNPPLSFVQGPKPLMTSKSIWAPTMLQNTSFKHTTADAGINTPTLGNLLTNTCCSLDTYLL